eukprot:TRINITY_DN6603_c0_g1_i1.p1 TRINITY_DN6603_c0_g1~~TRINITY_DN6603_c0_g1_i1.p1  ORF type:complete len:263 (-),score=56.93 TRINITY_DN6603_c0_g1_i1:32-742(-)
MVESGIEQWWRELPIVTKWLFALSMGTTVGSAFGIVPGMALMINWDRIINHFEIWRLFTCLVFHGGLGLPFLIHMVFLIRYGAMVEKEIFLNSTADFLFFLGFNTILLWTVSFFMRYFVAMALIMTIIYMWARKNPNVNMTFMFGIRFPAFYFPWVLVVMNFLMGGTPIGEIVGIVVSHIYFFFDEIYPNTGGPKLLKTPQFLYRYFPNAPVYGQTQQPQNQGAHRWGSGHTLGGN